MTTALVKSIPVTYKEGRILFVFFLKINYIKVSVNWNFRTLLESLTKLEDEGECYD